MIRLCEFPSIVKSELIGQYGGFFKFFILEKLIVYYFVGFFLFGYQRVYLYCELYHYLYESYEYESWLRQSLRPVEFPTCAIFSERFSSTDESVSI